MAVLATAKDPKWSMMCCTGQFRLPRVSANFIASFAFRKLSTSPAQATTNHLDFGAGSGFDPHTEFDSSLPALHRCSRLSAERGLV